MVADAVATLRLLITNDAVAMEVAVMVMGVVNAAIFFSTILYHILICY